MEKNKKPSILEANILYLVLGILLLFLGSIVQSREIYSGLLITEFIIILLPNIIYLKFKGMSFKKVFKLNKITLKQIIYIVLIAIFAYPVAVFLNTIVLTIINSVIGSTPTTVTIPDNFSLYLKSLFVIGIAPGICEEIMFRGTIMSAYERLGAKKAIIYSAFLFGIFHLTIFNLIGPIFLGIILGIVTYKTNSIYASILGHTLNNSIAMTLGYMSMKTQASIENISEIPEPTSFQLGILLVILFTVAYISYFILKSLIKNLPAGNREDMAYVEEMNPNFTDFIPIIFIIILFIIVNIEFVLV